MVDPSYPTAARTLRDSALLWSQRYIGQLLSISLAISAWLSQLPYFVWSRWALALLAGAFLTGTSGALAVWLRRHERFPLRDIAAGLCLAAFLCYITIQKTVAGDHSRWVVAIPTLLALFAARTSERRLAFSRFEFVFLLCLIPGLVYLLLMIVGVPLTFNILSAPNPQFGSRILQLPGAVFIESNSQALPWGGMISRLCGMYDEPGMVGTIAALLLAARAFDMRGWRAILLYVSGTLSLSLAFIVLAILGFGIRTVVKRDWKPSTWVIPLVMSSAFVLGVVQIPRSAVIAPRVIVEQSDGSQQVAPVQVEGAKVRQTEQINNRSQPQMDRLFEQYLNSDWTTRLFGIASNASSVYGGASAIWTRILTNHGILGFVLLTGAFIGYGWSGLRRAPDLFPIVMFLGAFALSFYQRPLVWFPYSLVLFFGAVAVLERSPADDRVAGDG